jgi:hypothetical protein
MATKKKTEDGLKLKDGMYFTATYKGKKIRGIIGNVYTGSYEKEVELDNKGYGEVSEDTDFPNILTVTGSVDETWDELLKKAGITNFIECKDKRQKAIIDQDKLPEFGRYNVKLEGAFLVFGCGAVELTPDQIKRYVKVRKIIGTSDLTSIIYDISNVSYIDSFDELDKYNISAMEDVVKTYKSLQALTKLDRDAFYEVINQVKEARDNSINVSDLDDYSDEKILALIDYFKK